MKPAGGSGRSRVLDGLIVAAVALLALKGLGLLMGPAEPALAPDGLPSFAHIFGYARSNYIPQDPATTGSVPDKPKEAPPAKVEEAKPAPPVADEPPPPSASQRAIGERLGERREELQRKSRDLETREKLIEELERRIDARSDELRKVEEKPSPATAAADAEAASLKPLVTMYETMKPKDAARVFDRLPQDVLVPVVRQINPRKMAEIMAAMSPDSAEKLTVALARRSRAGGDERPSVASLPAGELPAIEPAGRPAAPRRR